MSIIDEFDFTTLKIYQNFSNYSAWQRRSHLLPEFLETLTDTDIFGGGIDSFLQNEVEMCRNAAWTEPADQSIWFYQRWLFFELPKIRPDISDLMISLSRDQISSVSELIEEEGHGVNVSLAMSFVRFVLEKVLKEFQDSRLKTYLNYLIKVDSLRKGHWII